MPVGPQQGIVVRKELVTGSSGLPELQGPARRHRGQQQHRPRAGARAGGMRAAPADVELVEMSFADMGRLRKAPSSRVHPRAVMTNGVAEGRRVLSTVEAHPDEFYPDAQKRAVPCCTGPQFIANRRQGRPALHDRVHQGDARQLGGLRPRGEPGRDHSDILTRTTTVKDPELFERMAPSGLNRNRRHRHAPAPSRRTVERWVNAGQVRTRVDPAQVVDNSFVDYAIDRLGRYTPR